MSSGSSQPLHQAFLSLVPATRRERQWALVIVLVSCVGFLACMPFARLPAGRIDAFIPAYEAALCVNNLITAALLFGQFARVRSRALLALAAGYLLAAEIMLPHVLTFPGAFTPEGLLGAGPQSAPWLFIAWHFLFPACVLGYALLRGSRHEHVHAPTGQAIAQTVAAVTALVLAITVLVTAGHDWLPIAIREGAYMRPDPARLSPAIWLVPIAVLVVLWRRDHPSKLDLWLMVVMAAWVFDVVLTAVAGGSRYDLGFYAGRSYGLVAASFVLVVLLQEMNGLYAGLAAALGEAEARNAELARSREEFARVQRFEALGQLVGGLAHDFNNLLTVVIASLDLIQRDPGNPMKVARLTYTALDAAQRGERLTQQLLSFARRQVLRPEVVDPNRLVIGLQPLLQRAIGEQMQLVALLEPGLWPARLDVSEFEAALLNLVLNARDAMGGTGRITILTHNMVLGPDAAAAMAGAQQREHAPPGEHAKPGDYVTVAVRDSGTGMEPAVAARAFEPFFTTKEVGRGSGLGLSQVYGFVSAAGGHASIDSTPGGGATVILFLPRSMQQLPPETEPPALPAPPSVAAGHETILVVEDEPTVREVTVEGLELLGYQVAVAADGAQALKILRSDTPIDVLFSDVVMPGGINGAQLAAEACRLRPGLKVLLTSGYAMAALSREHGVPADLEVLSKPYRRDDLARRLRQLLVQPAGGTPPAAH